jgi:hypothetical protein
MEINKPVNKRQKGAEMSSLAEIIRPNYIKYMHIRFKEYISI